MWKLWIVSVEVEYGMGRGGVLYVSYKIHYLVSITKFYQAMVSYLSHYRSQRHIKRRVKSMPNLPLLLIQN